MTRQESECWDSAQRWHEKYLKAEAEIERLRADRIREMNVRKDYRAEIERMRATICDALDDEVARRFMSKWCAEAIAALGYDPAQVFADNTRLRAAVEQALDDMGEQGLSVCQQAKEMLQAALKDTTP